MKTRWWLILLGIVFAAGWFGGKHSANPAESAATHPQAATPPRPTDSRTASASDREPSRKHWAEKIANDTSPLPDFIREIPEKERGPAIEAWLKSCGSLLNETQLARLREVLTSWVAVDADSALAWSSTVTDPALRELAMTGVAGGLADSDPHRAFEHLVSHGEFSRNFGDYRLSRMMKTLSEEAMAQSPEAFAALWLRLPKAGPSVNQRSSVDIEYPAGTDFRALQEALKASEITSSRTPIFIGGLTAAWLKQDEQGALAYLVEQIGAKQSVSESWRDIFWEKKNELGKAGADQWGTDLITTLPEGTRGKFLTDSGFLLDDDRIAALSQSPEGSAWIREALQYSSDNDMTWETSRILKPFSEAQKAEYLKGLTPKAPGGH